MADGSSTSLTTRQAGLAGTLLAAVRPRQWTKNLALYAPLLFSKSVFVPGAALAATIGVLSFCLLAAGVYLMNDWFDRERDRAHPEKRRRPIAAGLLGGATVAVMIATLWSLGGVLSLWLGPTFAITAFGYLGLQFLYSLWLKHTVLLDVLLIALGFVLRVYAGGAAISVTVSNWLFLCTLLLALFLGFAKRRQELASLASNASGHRETLSHYSVSLLDQLIAICAGACIVSYGLYTVESQTAESLGAGRLSITLPCVVYGMFRYLYLVHQKGAGGSPERVLLSDRPTLLTVALFTALAGWALYG